MGSGAVIDSGPFRKVTLETRDGGFVHEAQVPPFVLMPEILVWGERHFIRHTDEIYREGFAFAVIDLNRTIS